MRHKKKIDAKDCAVLERLSFEVNGYDVLIRTFAQSSLEWNLDKEKWTELLDRRRRTASIIQEIVKRLCDHDYTGKYLVDFTQCQIEWE